MSRGALPPGVFPLARGALGSCVGVEGTWGPVLHPSPPPPPLWNRWNMTPRSGVNVKGRAATGRLLLGWHVGRSIAVHLWGMWDHLQSQARRRSLRGRWRRRPYRLHMQGWVAHDVGWDITLRWVGWQDCLIPTPRESTVAFAFLRCHWQTLGYRSTDNRPLPSGVVFLFLYTTTHNTHTTQSKSCTITIWGQQKPPESPLDVNAFELTASQLQNLCTWRTHQEDGPPPGPSPLACAHQCLPAPSAAARASARTCMFFVVGLSCPNFVPWGVGMWFFFSSVKDS